MDKREQARELAKKLCRQMEVLTRKEWSTLLEEISIELDVMELEEEQRRKKSQDRSQ